MISDPSQTKSITTNIGPVAAALLIACLFLLSGCDLWEQEPPHPPVTTKQRHPEVMVPAAVQGHWRAVVLRVLDKDRSTSLELVANLNQDYQLPDSDIHFKIKAFLPDFKVDGMTMTSLSNSLNNPAAQLVIVENDLEMFRGWLFSLYPNTLSYQHPRFNFNLVDFYPAGEKGVDKDTGLRDKLSPSRR